MIKYYTRACNFKYGSIAKELIKRRLALPLCGNPHISFQEIEIISRNKNKISHKIISIKKIKNLDNKQKKKIKEDIKNITKKRKNFLKNVNFLYPSIMGILNLTPDSFSDGGKFNTRDKSFKQISRMLKSGADIIDVGGESTRPGSKEVHPKNEWKRIEYVIKNFKKRYKKTCLSIDTRKSDLMVKSISHGVDLINDVSGFKHDKESLIKIKKFKVSKVLHHMQGTPNTMQKNPKYNNVLLDVYDYMEENINKRIKEKKIIIDPGIGFGKTLKHNLTLISKISLFHSLGFPILIGTSRKRFINQIASKFDSYDRTGGTLASVLYLLLQGVQIFRVHNVKEIKQGIMVFKKILLN